MSAQIERFRDMSREPNTLHFEVDPDIGYKVMKGRGQNRPADGPVIVIELDDDGQPQDVVMASDSRDIILDVERALVALRDALTVLRATGDGRVGVPVVPATYLHGMSSRHPVRHPFAYVRTQGGNHPAPILAWLHGHPLAPDA